MSELLELRDDVRELSGKVDEIGTSVAVVRATTEELGKRRDAETAAIWDRHNDLDKRVRVVETNYATQTRVSQVENDADDKFEKMERQILDLNKDRYRMIGMGMVAQVIVGAIVALVVTFVAAHFGGKT